MANFLYFTTLSFSMAKTSIQIPLFDVIFKKVKTHNTSQRLRDELRTDLGRNPINNKADGLGLRKPTQGSGP